jgi:hypothetical protein
LSRRLFNHVVIGHVQLRRLSSLFVDNALLILLVIFWGFRLVLDIRGLLLIGIDEPDNFFMLKLVKPYLLFFFFKNELLSLQLGFQLFSLSLESPDLFVPFFLNLSPLCLQFLDFVFKLGNRVFINLLMLRVSLLFLFFEFGLDFFHFGFFDNVCFMKLSDLLLFFIDRFHLFFGLLSQLFQLFFHPLDFLHCFLILIVLDGFVLGLSDFL